MLRAESGKEFPGRMLQGSRFSHAFLVLPVSVGGQKWRGVKLKANEAKPITFHPSKGMGKKKEKKKKTYFKSVIILPELFCPSWAYKHIFSITYGLVKVEAPHRNAILQNLLQGKLFKNI